jgi:hypothetical protein
VSAAGLGPIDTAHNTALSLLVEGGICALMLAAAIVAVSARSAFATKGALRVALITLLSVWVVSSLVGTVAESRTTWLLLALIALAARVAADEPETMACALSLPNYLDALNAHPDVAL